jgi:hypothetical protein
MVNKTQFHKTKIALAVVLSIGLAACGGEDSTSTSNSKSESTTDATQNTVGNQADLSGTVTGVVLDTNGNPVVGAAVYLAGAETTTDAGGIYVFNNVAVVNVAGVNNEGNQADDTVGTPLVITIAAAGHMGASVTVNPEAQVDNTGGQGDGQSGGNSNVTIQTYIDGFTAQAGTAQLPAISKRVYGYLRDCATNAPLVGGTVAFDFKAVLSGGTADTVAPGTTTTNNAAGDYSAMTDADGMFDIMVPADSTLTFLVNGWLSTDTDINAFGAPAVNSDITTEDEQIDLFLGTTEVCAVGFEEEPHVVTAPQVKSIDGQIGLTELVGDISYTHQKDADDDQTTVPVATSELINYAALTQGVVNNFVINFTEEMASTFDLSEARVKLDGATVTDATVTLSADGESATVTFVTDLDEGAKVDVWFPHWTAIDAEDSTFLVDNFDIGYDAVGVVIADNKSVYTHVLFCTFSKPVNEATVTLGPQIFDADTTEDGLSTDLSDYSLAFQDNDALEGTLAITQLNDVDALSSARLVALADARGETVTIDQDYAVVAYDGTNAASLNWMHGTTPVVTTAGAGTSAYSIVTNGTNTELHITPAAHNDTITVTPVNGFGDVLTAGAMTVTLVDAIAPTTVLQESYNITDVTGPRAGQDVVDGTTANAAFGNGGEVSAPGTTATAAGEPIIHIQPRHLAGQTAGAADRNDELNALTAGMSARLTASEVTALGGATAAQAAMSVTTTFISSFDMPIYDATAYAAWAAVPATIGVAFNEDVTMTATAPAFSGSSTLSGYAALNNVAADVDGNVVSVDLVTFDTPSVVALSLDAGADLGFVGSVTDSRANVSTANAQVFVQDTFPPMMTAAVWDGETLVLTFNEAPVITVGADITVIDPSATINNTTVAVSATNTVIAGNVMTITLSGAENLAVAPLFVSGANNEFAYNDDASTTNNLPEGEQHALIDWDNIADATGNEWSEFTPTLSSSNRGMEAAPAGADTRRWEVVAPRFLAVDEVGVFSYSVTTAGYLDTDPGVNLGDDDGTVTYTLTFTHAIDLTNSNAFSDVIALHPSYTLPITGSVSESTATADGTTVLNGLFLIDLNNDGADGFTLAANPVSANDVHGAVNISADHKVITLTVAGVANTATESITFNVTTVGLATTTDSAITGTQTSAGNFVWQSNN